MSVGRERVSDLLPWQRTRAPVCRYVLQNRPLRCVLFPIQVFPIFEVVLVRPDSPEYRRRRCDLARN